MKETIKHEVQEFNQANPEKHNCVLFLAPKSDEHTVFMLDNEVREYCKKYNVYFVTPRTNYAQDHLVKNGISLTIIKGGVYNSQVVKDVWNDRFDIEKYTKHYDELLDEFLPKKIDLIVSIGGPTFVMAPRAYTSHPILKKYKNSFMTVIDEYSPELEIEIQKTLKDPICNFPLNTFMFHHNAIMNAIVVNSILFRDCNHIEAFLVDTSVNLNYFKQYKKDLQIKHHAVVTDKRGSLDVDFYPIGKQMIAALREKSLFSFDDDYDFVFGGRMFIDGRNEYFEKYFKDFGYGRYAIHSPSQYGFNSKKQVEHENISQPIPYWELMKKLSKAKTTLIIPPWTKHDSHSLRIYECVAFGVVPLIDEKYDRDNIQIPKYIKDVLVVRSQEELIEKIILFSDKNKAKEILEKLENHIMKS